MSMKTIASRLPKVQFPEKFKGTIVERWANYWKGLARDYKDVGTDSIKTIKAKPLKSSIYGSLGAFLCGCFIANPNDRVFLDQFMTNQQLVSLVHPDCQNPATISFMKYIEQCRNGDTLRITSLGVVSIMWIADNAKGLSTYDAVCKYLKPEWKTFHERIIDVGFWNKWWNLHRQMKNYDVNF